MKGFTYYVTFSLFFILFQPISLLVSHLQLFLVHQTLLIYNVFAL